MKCKVRCDLNVAEEPTVITLVRLKLDKVKVTTLTPVHDMKDYEAMEV